MREFHFMLCVVILVLALSLGACLLTGQPQDDHVHDEEQDAVILVSADDEEMNAAIQQAQDTLDVFIKNLQSPKPAQADFAIKVRFLLRRGEAEHIWVIDVSYEDDRFTGVVDNVPVNLSEIELGDRITVTTEMVSDWFFIEDGRLVGGYTIRVLRSRMSPDERERFDAEFGALIED